MPSTSWESSDLLTRFNEYAGRPTTDAITDAMKYRRLADAQNEVIMSVANVASRSIIGTPTAMTSSDGGYTWTFGTDGNGYALFPLSARIYPSLNAIPDWPWNPGVDYLDEGDQIRIPNNMPWSGTLYWQGITPPEAISASVQPVIMPPAARILIVIRAVQRFAEEYLRNAAVADQMAMRWDREWPKYATMLRKHFRGGGSLGPLAWPFFRGGPFGVGA